MTWVLRGQTDVENASGNEAELFRVFVVFVHLKNTRRGYRGCREHFWQWIPFSLSIGHWQTRR